MTHPRDQISHQRCFLCNFFSKFKACLCICVSYRIFSYIQQSSTDIWLAVCAAVKLAIFNANVIPEDICGLGFAATCSLGQGYGALF